MNYQDRILEIQEEIKTLEVQNSNLFGVIKGCMIAKQLNEKAKYKNERQLIGSKLVGLRAEMNHLQSYGKNYV